MLFIALASDYDGTMAAAGQVDQPTLDALAHLKSAGKKLLLVTGRELSSLKSAFGALDLFDVVVAENGAVLYFPKTLEERPIAAPPLPAFISALREKSVSPLSIGHCIVATWTPNEDKVLECIRELGLDWQLTFNKGAVMCLPPGVNKASGLTAALEELKLSTHNVIGIGDAENDQAFLSLCGCAVAVANAIDSVKAIADVTTPEDHGAGVVHVIEQWLGESGDTFSKVKRHDLYLGEGANGGRVLLESAGATLIAGASGGGKSRLTTLLVERLVEAGYQVCIVDPEGDYEKIQHFTNLGDALRTPAPEEVLSLLNSPRANVVVNLLATEMVDRPTYFNRLMGQIAGLRSHLGRPHWLILDEAHHLCPRVQPSAVLPPDLATVFITSHPEQLSSEALAAVHSMIVVGDAASEVVASYVEVVGGLLPREVPNPNGDEVLYWQRSAASVERVKVGRAKQQLKRHTRKYAEGRLGEDISFYFRGPDNALNLRAYNLATFMEIARGVDDSTWMFHLSRGDYSQWFREVIKDVELGAESDSVQSSKDPADSREAIFQAIKRRYVITKENQ
jgi:hypothetical protein